MKRLFFSVAVLALFFSSCSNADPKQMAADLCDCVKTKKKLGSKSKKILLKAAKSDDFQSSYQNQLQAVEDDTEREEIQSEVTDLMKVFQSKKTQQCADAIDKKYHVYKSQEKEMQQKLVDEMENVDDCEVYAAIVKAGLKQQGKIASDDDATGDEEEKPKKKSRTTGETEE